MLLLIQDLSKIRKFNFDGDKIVSNGRAGQQEPLNLDTQSTYTPLWAFRLPGADCFRLEIRVRLVASSPTLREGGPQKNYHSTILKGDVSQDEAKTL